MRSSQTGGDTELQPLGTNCIAAAVVSAAQGMTVNQGWTTALTCEVRTPPRGSAGRAQGTGTGTGLEQMGDL